ncbi:type VII secretion protein EccB [Micromonospora sp. NPDC049559]|uniref:type VII secretion protein EccB n=1 Tax=Micromonospora sp. NPDC049559 TaxID=3155923 RepID=UPI00343F3B9A
MRTRREQVQAYRFVTRRIGSAMLSGEPETTELPMRRLGLAVFGSAMLATIVFAGVGVYGFLRPGGGRPADNQIVIERETGARYVYIQGRLHPVLNYSSARLIVGAAQPTVQTLSRRSLRDVPRGEPVGIPNAPDALPDPAALDGLPWSTCSMRRSPGSAALAAHVLVGSEPAGGTTLAGDGLLVSTGTGSDAVRYLLWNSHRLKVPDGATLAALELTAATPVPVDQALLNSIAAGPDLKPGFVYRAGEDGVAVDGKVGKIGQVYRSGEQFYLLLDRGLVTIGETMARLLLAGGQQVVDISASAAGAVQGNPRFEPDGFPNEIPRLRNGGGEPAMVCASYRDASPNGGQLTTIELFTRADERLTEASANLPPVQVGLDGVRLADRVLLTGGHGALVQVLPAPGTPATGATRYLVTDQGIKYALPRQDAPAVQQSLGYPDATPVPVPSYLLALIPTGPALDPAAALRFLPKSEPSAGPPAASPSAGA